MRTLAAAIILFPLFYLGSCNGNPDIMYFKDTDPRGWSDTLVLELHNDYVRTGSDMYIVVRSSDIVEPGSFGLEIITMSPDSITHTDHIDVRFPTTDKDNKIKEEIFPYRNNVTLDQAGNYRVKIMPLDGVTPKNILSVGIIVK